MDIDVAVPLLLTLVVVVAAFIRRWWAVVLPLGVIPLFYAGLKAGWWGDGVGEGWQYAAVMVTIIGLLGSALGVAVGRALDRIVRH
jgi:ascorbate-specific PTS system EIIC-type component UlaA